MNDEQLEKLREIRAQLIRITEDLKRIDAAGGRNTSWVCDAPAVLGIVLKNIHCAITYEEGDREQEEMRRAVQEGSA